MYVYNIRKSLNGYDDDDDDEWTLNTVNSGSCNENLPVGAIIRI